MPQRTSLAAAVPHLSVIVFVIVLVGIFTSTAAEAIQVDYPPGCYVCKNTGLFVNDCMDPPSFDWGNTSCQLTTIFIYVFCSTSGDSCMYVCAGDCGGGGGFGGGGGTGGSTCDTSGGWCPPDCFSCGGQSY